MSKLRVLTRAIKEMKGERLTFIERVQERIDDNKIISKVGDWYYSIKAFFSNLPMFVKFAWRYRSWDYTYNIEIFITLLEDTARNLKSYGHSVNSLKCARRAFTAAGLLRKAYIDDIDNRTHNYIHKKYGYSFSPRYKKPPPEIQHRVNRMLIVSARRAEREERELKKQAWNYVHKYIEYFWD